jgi:subfamily B ATP-binding cassette protein MsbA
MAYEDKALYLRLLRHAAPYWRHFLAGTIATAVTGTTEPALAWAIKPMVDGSLMDKDPFWITVMPVLLIGIFLVRGASGFLSSTAMNWVSQKIIYDLRVEMFDKLLRLPMGWYDHSSSGTVISMLSFNTTQLTSAATGAVLILVRDSITVLFLVALLFWYAWDLALSIFIAVPVALIVVKLFATRLRGLAHRLQDQMGDMTQVMEEAVGGHRVIRIFGGEDYERRRFRESSNWARRIQMKIVTASAAHVPVVQFVTAVVMSIMIYLATLKSAAGGLTLGEFGSFFAAMGLLFPPVKRLTRINEDIQRGLAAARTVFGLIDTEDEPDRGSRVLERPRGGLVMRDVRFTYPHSDAPAIDGLSLTIAPGETVALVGPSGSGKTTLINLIPRFYHPQSGEILIDGIDIEELRLASLRANIALVSQEVVLFNDTLAANIAYGPLANVPRERIEAAAKAAHAMEFIKRLPEGLDTRVGERGARLSGGQRQRVAIARAILKDAPILILDEATSNLDTESERHVQDALETLRQGRTTLIIAHRLSTVETADRVVVLDRGRIVETGTHAELLAKSGLYSDLYQLQFSTADQTISAA